MLQKFFKCNMCGQILEGFPKTRVAFIGFIWEPVLNADPKELFDICEACQYAFLTAYAKAKSDRLEAVYEKQRAGWTIEKMEGLEKARNRINKQAFAVREHRIPEHLPAGSMNYRKEEQKEWRF